MSVAEKIFPTGKLWKCLEEKHLINQCLIKLFLRFTTRLLQWFSKYPTIQIIFNQWSSEYWMFLIEIILKISFVKIVIFLFIILSWNNVFQFARTCLNWQDHRKMFSKRSFMIVSIKDYKISQIFVDDRKSMTNSSQIKMLSIRRLKSFEEWK